jgi:hypothetical protein
VEPREEEEEEEEVWIIREVNWATVVLYT